MWTAAISIFPRMFDALTGGDGVVGRAIARDLLSFRVMDPRDHADDRHATVDDRPYGGGPGMVMKAEPLTRALNEARAAAPRAPDRLGPLFLRAPLPWAWSLMIVLSNDSVSRVRPSTWSRWSSAKTRCSTPRLAQR